MSTRVVCAVLAFAGCSGSGNHVETYEEALVQQCSITPPAGSYPLDLDGNSQIDTYFIGVGTGGNAWFQSCLIGNGAPFGVFLSSDASVLFDYDGASHNAAAEDAPRFGMIGDFTGDQKQEVFVLFAHGTGPQQPAVAVIDVMAQSTLGNVVGPPPNLYYFDSGGVMFVNVLLPKDTAGRAYPFLVPGYGDDNAHWAPDNEWSYGCLFRYDPSNPGAFPAPSPGAQCDSQNFVAVSIEPPVYDFQRTQLANRFGNVLSMTWSRENGGYLQDLDGDGWDDINLLYHYREYTIPGRIGMPGFSGQPHDTFFDPGTGWNYSAATPSPPPEPAGFHSGRTYGTHVAIQGVDSANNPVNRTVIVAGSAVGSNDSSRPAFYENQCNVSRWVGILQSPAGNSGQRVLKWSHYYGFDLYAFPMTCLIENSTTCSDPTQCSPIRDADWLNGCVHRFSNGISTWNGGQVIAFDKFTQSSVTVPSTCAVNQCIYDSIPDCVSASADSSQGTWSFEVMQIADSEQSITSIPNRYVWGRSDQIYPDHAMVYLAETPSSSSWKLWTQTTPLVAATLKTGSNPTLQTRDTLPMGRPVISTPYPYQEDMSSFGDDSYFAELTLQDVDGDNLQEVEMQNGSNCQWVGYSKTQHKLVSKGAVPCN
jgi:hypothetical protein